MRRQADEGRAYVVTLWTFGERPLFGHPDAARLFCRVLTHLKRRLHFRLHAFVLLPDRARLVVATPDADPRSVQIVVHRLKSRFAREWNARRGRLGLVWQDADQMAALEGVAAIARRARILHQSPVVTGLARRAGEWSWSSARVWDDTGGAPAPVDLPVEAVAGAAEPAVSG
jgi:putative transposase